MPIPTTPAKILTVEDCELRIKNYLEKLDAIDADMLEEDIASLEAGIAIWNQVQANVEAGHIVTLDSNETFGFWPKQP